MPDTPPLRQTPMEETSSVEEILTGEALPGTMPEALNIPTQPEALTSLEAELASWKDKAYRAAAEAENARKRAAVDIADARLYAVSALARDILGVADNLGRALAAPEGNEKSLRDGVQMVSTQLSGMLDKHGIKKVEVVAGIAPNPDFHQAMLEVEGPAGQIVSELQSGYTLNGRLLRAALVSVGKRGTEETQNG